MEVILDELTPLEFFKHGGIVKITVSEDLMKTCNVKKKYTFFEYKAYVRFLRNLYMSKEYDAGRNDMVNKGLTLKPSIGTSEYVVDLSYDHVLSYEFAKFYYTHDRSEPEVSPRDPYGIPNVCFSKITEKDERWEKYTQQRLDRGFDNSELWNLEGTIAKFIAPRLRAFYEDAKIGKYRPANVTLEEWLNALEKMTEGFELMALDREKTEYEEAVECEALGLFSDYFFSLWN